MPERRFPSPWSFEELDACFVVTDSAGEKLAYVYFEDDCFPKNWPEDREQRARIIGEWLQTEARYLA
jgi:hypothetical protein